ncbi:MAG: hypothetical protein JWP30_1593 [Homoserinimonas sp.]|nr:hypothetical protein [Homoserinimonas sp.]
MSRRHRAKPASWHLGLMLALTFSTGIIDAVGFLGLDRVFTANMTGNVVILGMGLAGAQDLPILGPAAALAAFMLGAAAGGFSLRRRSAGEWSATMTVLLGVVGLLLLAIGIAVLLVETPGEAALLAITGTLAGAMGLQAAAARTLAVKDVTTVVITSTITGLAADLWLRNTQGNVRRRASVVLLMLAGAVAGAALLQVHLGAGLIVAAVICFACAILGHLFGRERPGTDARDQRLEAHTGPELSKTISL